MGDESSISLANNQLLASKVDYRMRSPFETRNRFHWNGFKLGFRSHSRQTNWLTLEFKWHNKLKFYLKITEYSDNCEKGQNVIQLARHCKWRVRTQQLIIGCKHLRRPYLIWILFWNKKNSHWNWVSTREMLNIKEWDKFVSLNNKKFNIRITEVHICKSYISCDRGQTINGIKVILADTL